MKRIHESEGPLVVVIDCPTWINVLPYIHTALYSLQNWFLPTNSFSSHDCTGRASSFISSLLTRRTQAPGSRVPQCPSLGVASQDQTPPKSSTLTDHSTPAEQRTCLASQQTALWCAVVPMAGIGYFVVSVD